MSRPIIRIHDLATDTVIDREMNDEEFAVFEKERLAREKEQLKLEEAAEAKAALLAKLGITEEEAKLLLS